MTPPATNHQDSDDILDLTQVAKSIYRQKWYILLTAIIVGVGSATLVLFLRDTYEASASIKIDTKQTTTSVGLQSILTGAAVSSAETQVEIVQSRSNLIDAIERGELVNYVEPAPPHIREVAQRIAGSLGWGQPLRRKEAASIEISALNLSSDFIDQDIELEYLGGENILAKLPDGEEIEGSAGSTISSSSGKIKLNISNISAIPGEKFLVRKESIDNTLSRISRDLSVEEIGNTAIIKLSYKDYSPERVHGVLRALIDSYIAADDRYAVNSAQQSLDYIESQVEPALKAIEDAEDALTRYRKETESINVELETEYLLKQMLDVEQRLREDQRAGERQTLERIWNEYRARLAELPDTQQQTLNLTRDIEVAQTLYLELMKRVQDMRALRVSAQGVARIIDDPYVPSQPSGPRRARIVLISILIASLIHMLIIALQTSARSEQ